MPTSANIEEAGEERRRWQRHQLNVPVRVTIEDPRYTTLVDTRACEMNDGGTAIYAKAQLRVGTHVEIEFMAPWFDFPLTLRGVVRNAAQNRYPPAPANRTSNLLAGGNRARTARLTGGESLTLN